MLARLAPGEVVDRFDELFQNDEFKWNLSVGKDYDWVFNDRPCTICTSLYQALLHKLGDPTAVFRMIHARPYHLNRRLGEGVSVFNPGDRTTRQPVLTNPQLAKRIGSLLQDSNQVRYVFSRYARTNAGVFALMDLKGYNKDRLHELHNIVSDGVHKVEELEEHVNSLFLAVMNPEDTRNIQDIPSFTDRVEYLQIPYVLDDGDFRRTFGVEPTPVDEEGSASSIFIPPTRKGKALMIGGVAVLAGTFAAADGEPVVFAIAAPRAGRSLQYWRMLEQRWVMALMEEQGGAIAVPCGKGLPFSDTFSEIDVILAEVPSVEK